MRLLPHRPLRALAISLLALWIPLAPAGRASCLAAGLPKGPVAKSQLRCHDKPASAATASQDSAAKPKGCCCKRTPTISSGNCGCHHGDSAWPVARDQAMPGRADRIAVPLPSLSAFVVIVTAMAPRANDPPELPPPKTSRFEHI